MAAYSTMEPAFAGLIFGEKGRIDSLAAKYATDILFGAAVMGYQDEEGTASAFLNDVDKLAFDADFITSNTIDITVNGAAMATVTFTTDHDTTADLVVAALNNMTGVEAVLDSADANNRTFLIRTKGITCVVTENVLLGASQAAGTITSHSGQVLLGIARNYHNEDGKYVQYDTVPCLAGEGEIYVLAEVNVKANSNVYLTTTGGFGIAGTQINAVYKQSATAGNIVRVALIDAGQTAMTYGASF